MAASFPLSGKPLCKLDPSVILGARRGVRARCRAGPQRATRPGRRVRDDSARECKRETFTFATKFPTCDCSAAVSPFRPSSAFRGERLLQNADLKRAGLKATLPRLRILEILEDSTDLHVSAEDVYDRLRASGESIGLATVYRVLTQFEQARPRHPSQLRRWRAGGLRARGRRASRSPRLRSLQPGDRVRGRDHRAAPAEDRGGRGLLDDRSQPHHLRVLLRLPARVALTLPSPSRVARFAARTSPFPPTGYRSARGRSAPPATPPSGTPGSGEERAEGWPATPCRGRPGKPWVRGA